MSHFIACISRLSDMSMTIVRMMIEATHSLSFRMHLLKSDTHIHTRPLVAFLLQPTNHLTSQPHELMFNTHSYRWYNWIRRNKVCFVIFAFVTPIVTNAKKNWNCLMIDLKFVEQFAGNEKIFRCCRCKRKNTKKIISWWVFQMDLPLIGIWRLWETLRSHDFKRAKTSWISVIIGHMWTTKVNEFTLFIPSWTKTYDWYFHPQSFNESLQSDRVWILVVFTANITLQITKWR